MRRYIVIVILLASCFISCKTIQAHRIEEGKFIKTYKYSFLGSECIGEDELILNQDSTFSFERSSHPVGSIKCQGKWYYLDNKTIHLKCDDEKKYYLTLPHDTSSKILFDQTWVKGYMRVRERNVKIVNENKIKLEIPEAGVRKYIVLKRVMGNVSN